MNKSAFQFKGFFIKNSQIQIKDDIDKLDLIINFEPKGIIDEKESIFKLALTTLISDKNKKLSIEVVSEGVFKTDDLGNEQLEQYLFTNAPAILFPYIRAYITTLTALSGITPVTLPTLNLSQLKDEIKKNLITY